MAEDNRQSVSAPVSHCPIKIIEVKVQQYDSVAKEQVLGIYEYTKKTTEIHPETGAKNTVHSRTREELKSPFEGRVESVLVTPGDVINDPRKALMIVVEPCGHSVQLNGLCAICGKDLTIGTYLVSETSRATIRMTHDASGVTVSQKEALRIEQETQARLLKEKKLSLVLDLDQTVIHATGDPTVGDWMADQGNPNYPKLKEVHSFVLPGSPITYYIKLRPGTREFLAKQYKNYEMHIYTMGTRDYAVAVAKILDPDNNYFKNRILSRDDSGSFSFKSLQRLFPCDQSMVVVVDDRGDVWNWSLNLIRAKAYEFFSGIGDINEPAYIAAAKIDSEEGGSHTASVARSSPRDGNVVTSSSSSDTFVSPSSATSSEKEILAEMKEAQIHALQDQQTDRPLLHSQEAADGTESSVGSINRPVLQDKDDELKLISSLMDKIHSTFYRNPERGDVRVILPQMKQRVLAGVHILFSSIIPVAMNQESHEYWHLAVSHGAICHKDLDIDVTHVVAAKKNTAKVNAARKLAGVVIVTLDWLLESVKRWKRQDEFQYLIDPNIRPVGFENIKFELDAQEEEDQRLVLSSQPVVEVTTKFGNEDWQEMDREVEEAMLDDGSSGFGGEDDGDSWSELDNEFEEEFESLKNNGDDLISGSDPSAEATTYPSESQDVTTSYQNNLSDEAQDEDAYFNQLEEWNERDNSNDGSSLKRKHNDD